jgi:NTP pyrophosphatase (non-canonical NTP hydrolase)
MSDVGDERDLTLREAQAAVDAWISRSDAGYWPPLANLARLIEEVGELARELNHRYGSKPKKSEEPDAELALEMADILFVLLALANEQGIDLGEALERVLAKYEMRDSGRFAREQEGASRPGESEQGKVNRGQ